MTICNNAHREWPFFESLPHDQDGVHASYRTQD